MYPLGNRLFDACKTLNGAPTALSSAPFTKGLGLEFNGTSSEINFGDVPSVDFAGAYSLFVLFRPDAQAGARREMLLAKDTDTGRQFTVELNPAGISGTAAGQTGAIGHTRFVSNAAYYQKYSAANVVANGSWYSLLIGSTDGSSDIVAYLDGASLGLLDGSGLTTGLMQATATAMLAGRRDYPANFDYFDGGIAAIGIANVAPSADLAKLLFENPWQVLEPRTQNIFTSDAAGGSVGASSGTAAVSGIGSSTATTEGTSNGVGAGTGVGASSALAAGSSAGVGAASGIGASTSAAEGASAGVGAGAGVGTSTAASVGASVGVGFVSGTGTSTAAATGSSAGVAVATGIAPEAADSGVGASSGVATVAGVGASTVSAVGTSAGASSVAGVSGNGAIAVPEEVSYALQKKTRAPNFAPRKAAQKPKEDQRAETEQPIPSEAAETVEAEWIAALPSINRLRAVNDLTPPDSMLALMQKRRAASELQDMQELRGLIEINRLYMYNIRARAALLAA